MERLTQHVGGCVFPIFENCGESPNDDIINRLAAYEDTGLEPSEIETIISNFESFLCEMTGNQMSKSNYTLEAMISVANDYQQSLCDDCSDRAELAEYRKAEREGRCVIARPDVARFAEAMDTVLKKHDPYKTGWENEPYLYIVGLLDKEISELMDARALYARQIKNDTDDLRHELIDVSNICMMLYCNLTREAAEAALAKKGEI